MHHPPQTPKILAPPSVPDHELWRCIGQGSYGEVWLARNAVGTGRAIKLVYRARFADDRPYEREFAGIQKYEPISRTNDGLVDILQIGRHDAGGYFYYVMELADDAAGEQIQRSPQAAANYIPKTLARHIQSRGRLPFEECLTLGLTLNLALGHLHRHGLMHRDVKPSNIIFVNGVPKLADIGLVTGLEEGRSFVGTEGFIPPEGPNSPQADIYALGKVLYEAGMGKDRQEFPEPFTGLGLNEESKRLMELNAVLLRACAPNLAERYQTAEEMNADLALLHSGGSVQQKHALERRLRMVTRIGAAAAAVVALGIVPYYLAIKEARLATATAKGEAEQRQRAEAGEKQAQTEAVRSGQVAHLLEEMLANAGPSVALGRDSAMLRDILDKTAQRAAKDLTNQPEVAADLLLIIGKTYDEMGQYTNALAVTREALRLRQLYLKEEVPETGVALHNIGAILYDAGDLAGAEAADREALRLKRKFFGNENTNVAETLNNLGVVLWNRGQLAEAEDLERQALAIRKNKMGAQSAPVGMTLNNLAGVLWTRGDFAGAETQFGEAAALFRKLLGDQHPVVATMLNNLGTALLKKGDFAGAEADFAQTLAIRKKIFGADHPEVANALTQLALARAGRGQFDEAEAMARDALAMETKLSLGDHPYVADSQAVLGLVLGKKGDLAGAEKILSQALAMRQKVLGAESPDVAESLDSLAILRATSGDLASTEPMLRHALEMDTKIIGAENPDVLPLLSHLAWVLEQKGDAASAESFRRQAAAITSKEQIYVMSAWAEGSYDLVDLLQVRGTFTHAEPLLLEAAATLAKGSQAIRPLQRRALERLVRFYEAWDRAGSNADAKTNAALWRSRLDSLDVL